MSEAKKVATNQASIYLPDATHKRLKIAAVERSIPFNTLVCEALTLWWGTQPESKTKGALFPGEASATAPVAAPIAIQSEQSPPMNTAPEDPGSVTKGTPTKPQEKGLKKPTQK